MNATKNPVDPATFDMRVELTPQYKKDYSRGWVSYHRSTEISALDRADARGESDAWYDGYLDGAAGREKWHMPKCAAHHNGPDGCGWA